MTHLEWWWFAILSGVILIGGFLREFGPFVFLKPSVTKRRRCSCKQRIVEFLKSVIRPCWWLSATCLVVFLVLAISPRIGWLSSMTSEMEDGGTWFSVWAFVVGAILGGLSFVDWATMKEKLEEGFVVAIVDPRNWRLTFGFPYNRWNILLAGAVACLGIVVLLPIRLQDFERCPGPTVTDAWRTNDVRCDIRGLSSDAQAHGGRGALRFQVKPEDKKTGDRGGAVSIQGRGDQPLDLSTAKRISIWVYDTRGNNTVELRLVGKRQRSNAVWSTEKSVRRQWTQITWRIADFYVDNTRDEIGLRGIKAIELFEYWDDLYFVDDLSAE